MELEDKIITKFRKKINIKCFQWKVLQDFHSENGQFRRLDKQLLPFPKEMVNNDI